MEMSDVQGLFIGFLNILEVLERGNVASLGNRGMWTTSLLFCLVERRGMRLPSTGLVMTTGNSTASVLARIAVGEVTSTMASSKRSWTTSTITT